MAKKQKDTKRYRLRRAFAWRGRYVTRRHFAEVIEMMPAEDRDRYVKSGAILDTEAAAEAAAPAKVNKPSKDGNG